MSFADFLDIMHIHSRAEDLPREVVDAFKAADPAKKGTIPARQLRHMLLHWGEQLSAKEGKCQGIYKSWLIFGLKVTG
jgi:Ca2+-binding EF-hand superfamily protein